MEQPEVDKIAEEAIYTVMGHGDAEASRLPLSPNSLFFTNKVMDAKYNARLLGSGEMTQTFRNNVILFSSSVIAFCLTAIITFVVEYYGNGRITQRDLVLHLIALMGLLVLGVALMVAVRLSERIRLLMKRLYLAYMLLMVLYLTTCDQRVLAKFSDSSYSYHHINYSIVLMIFLYLYHLISFSYFLGVFVLSATALSLFLVLFLVCSPVDEMVTVADFVYLTVFCVLLCFHTREIDYRARNLFYRMVKEEECSADSGREQPKLDSKQTKGIGTEGERLIEMCEKVQSKVRAAASVVILAEVKAGLKESLLLLDMIKQRVAKGNLHEVDRLEMQKSLDEEDQEFIRQQFYHKGEDVGRIGKSPTVNLMNRRGSIVEIPEFGLGQDSLISSLSSLGTRWSFDIWEVHNSAHHSVFIAGKYLMRKWELLPALNVTEKVADLFFMKVEKGYASNPYHNACHGADVCHSLLYFLDTSNLMKKLTSLELASCIISSLGHDVGHPGLNNRFLVNNREELAICYNDISVLENMHVAKLFQIMQDQERNVLGGVVSEDWTAMRKLIVTLVLHTDMSKHFETLGQFRNRSQSGLGVETSEERTFVLSMGLKCADIGHSAKPTELHLKWSDLVTEEFFHQGDLEKEKGLPVSMYCDRLKTDVAKSQAGFLKAICVPLFEAWTHFLECTEINENCMEQIINNLVMWEGRTKAKKASMLLLANTLGGKDLGLGAMAGAMKEGLKQVAKSD